YLEEPLSNIRIYRRALKTNTELRKQNILLLDRLNRIRADNERNNELRAMLNFRKESNLQLYPVQIVGKNLKGVNDVITIDAGFEDGIEKSMPFISSRGLIGKVVLTAPHYAQVMPFIHPLFRVSAVLRKSNAYGIVSWSGENIDRLILKYIPKTVPVDSGEVVVTSGYSNGFPPNIPIGSVLYAESEKGRETKNIYLKSFVNIYRVAEGFVVTSQPDSTVKKLNNQYQKMFE